MIVSILATALFLVSTILFSIVVVSPQKNSLTLRSIGIIFAVLIVASYPMSWIGIPLNLFTFSGVLIILSLMYCGICFIKDKNIVFLKKRFSRENLIPKKKSLLPLLVFGLSVAVGLFYFRADLKTPQYYSLDAATHLLVAEHTQQTQKLLIFSRDLYYPDARNIAEYPFGSAVVNSTIFNTLFFLSHDVSFQLISILFFSLINAYFFSIFQRHFEVKNPVLIATLILLQTVGFFLNLMALGFTAQLIGLFFLLLFVDLYLDTKDSPRGVLFCILAFVATFFTYYYWIPITLLFLGMDNLHLLNIKNLKANSKVILYRFVLLVLSTIIIAPYILTIIGAHIVKYVADDGGSYKIFLLNFIFFLPLILIGLINLIKGVTKGKTGAVMFVLATILYTLGWYIAYRLGYASSYFFTKTYYITGPILYLVAIKTLDEIVAELKNNYAKLLPLATLGTLLLIFAIMPFQKNVDHGIEPPPSAALPMNTLSLDGRLFDVFYFDIEALVRPSFHRVNIDADMAEFMANFKEHLPAKDQDLDKISVVTDYDTALWFYVRTGVWPRSLEDRILLYQLELVDLDLWRATDKSQILILMTGNEMTEEWIKRYNFNMNDFKILYQVGDNYLLESVN